MLTGSLSFGRLAGATMRIHWSAFIVVLLIGWGLADELGVPAAALGVVAFFVSILAHELAHRRADREGGQMVATREPPSCDPGGRVAGQFVAWAIIAVGFFVLVRGEGGILLMITGLFILVNAKVEIAAAAMGERLDGITVGDLTWYGVAHAGPDMDADSMLWQRRRLGAAGWGRGHRRRRVIAGARPSKTRCGTSPPINDPGSCSPR